MEGRFDPTFGARPGEKCLLCKNGVEDNKYFLLNCEKLEDERDRFKVNLDW